MSQSTMISILFIFTLLAMAALFALGACTDDAGPIAFATLLGVPALVVLVMVRGDQERGL